MTRVAVEVRLGDVLESLDQGWSPRCEKRPAEDNTEWCVMKTTAVQPLDFRDDENKALPAKLRPRSHLELRPGDLLTTRAGPRTRVGITCLVRATRPRLMLCDKVYRMRVKEEFARPGFVEAMLNAPQSLAEIERLKTGISDSGLNLTQERFKDLSFPLPGLGEQARIEAELDSYLSRLDDVVATLERVQRNLKRYRASVLKAAVEGRLVPTETELARKEGRDYEPADVLLQRILEERKARWIEEAAEKARARAEKKATKAGKPWSDADDQAALEKGRKAAAKKYEEPEPPDVSELPELPEGWIWTQLDQLLATGLSNGRSVPTADTRFPMLRLTALKGTRIDLAERKTGRWTRDDAEAHLVSGGDILVARGNGSIRLVGWGGLVGGDPDEVAFPDTMIRIRLVPGDIDPEFFVAIWNSRLVRDQLERRARTTAGIYKVNQAILESIVLPLPPLPEQRRLVAEIDRHETIVDATVRTAEVNEMRAGRLRQSILKWAFEGRLVDQDPNDEPASVLLERIAAEREEAGAKNGKKKRRRKARKKTC